MNLAKRKTTIFKQCSNCGFEWLTREQWLRDPLLELVGYQVSFKALKTGILLFNHRCRTTLALYASDFEDLYDGPVFKERATGTDDCPGYCLHQDNLAPCPARCECSYVRNIIQLIRSWPKENADDQLKVQADR